MDILIHFYDYLTSALPGIYIQQDGSDLFSQGGLYKNSSADTSVIIYLLLGLTTLISSLVYGLHRYSKWKKFKLFEDEMKSLDLNPDDESAFSGMVKRFEMEEPFNILMSARLFDEMATKEIEKVLGSAGSKSAKEKFIETVYRIRTRTYHADWLQQKEQAAPAGTLHLSEETEQEMAVN